MFVRQAINKVLSLANVFPVITLYGPRQSGKTTLVKHLFPSKPYINLELPTSRDLISRDVKTFLANHQKGCIFDEIQRMPELLSYIQVMVDESSIMGQFIVTGSHQLLLQNHVSQSLAGRTAIFNLYPLSSYELKENHIDISVDEQIYKGSYPALYTRNIDSKDFYISYIQTYLERDVREIINVKDLNLFRKFIIMLAARVGSVINIDSISNDVGVSGHTIKNWLSVLEASFLIYTLTPFFENIGKRLIKSPKIYFTDTGLLCNLLSIENVEEIGITKYRGCLFENLVIMELIKYLSNNGIVTNLNLYFYRDSSQKEIDLIYRKSGKFYPIEIKSTATFTSSLLDNIEYYYELVGDKAPFGFLVYNGESTKVGKTYLVNYSDMKFIYDQLVE